MDRLVSDVFYNILIQISDQNFDVEHIFTVFKKELPAIVKDLGIISMKAVIYEPIRRSNRMNISEIEMFCQDYDEETNDIELDFPTGNGGRVVVVTGLKKDAIWTEDLKKDNYVISRTVYLLVGRAKTMTTLSNLMFFDQLTGIPNETGLSRFMGEKIAKGEFTNYCTNFLNIKNMKLINNRYGDDAGDMVMTGYANALSQFATDKANGIVARLGGDNFFAFIDKNNEEAFLEFVKKIVVSIETAGRGTKQIAIDSRVGSYYIKPGDGINEAMRNADVAVKLARKDLNPDYVLFEESMKTHLLKIRQLEQNIPSAIENKEFVVYYQPKVKIGHDDSYITNGAEALVRWFKDGEMISPGDFVPVLEKSGLIALIDYYVLEQVCKDINEWIERGIQPVKVSTNFSRRHLQDRDFADKIIGLIRKYNIDPKYIEIEITESYDDEDMQALLKFEKKMHEVGIDLAVDDFGSGFSSLKMIKNIVADTIKLDKSIIDGIGDNGPDDIIISHIIMMINSLGKKIIAEGVETEKQAHFLRDNGCDNIQGFLYARPCAKENFEKYIMQ